MYLTSPYPNFAGLHVTSRRPCWRSRTEAFLSSGQGTKPYFRVNFSRKNYIVLTANMAALSRGCKPRIQSTLSKTNTFGTGTVNLVARVLHYQSRRREPWEGGCGTVCVHRFLLCFPRQHWIRGRGERFFIWQQCAFSSGQPKNVGIFVMCLNRFLFDDCNTLIDVVNSLYEIVFVYWLLPFQKDIPDTV